MAEPIADFPKPKEREFPDSKNSGKYKRKETRGAISRGSPKELKREFEASPIHQKRGQADPNQ